MKYKKKQILKLRREFYAAFEKSTGEKIPKGIERHKSDAYWDPIRKQIKEKLGLQSSNSRLIENQTLRKVLFEENDLNFYPSTLKIFRDYIESVLSSGNSKIDFLSYRGAMIINREFKRFILSNGKNLKPQDYYLGKLNDNCQWYGVLKENNWDIERRNYDEIKSAILRSIAQKVIDNISVISGPHGVGKSTVLRRLAKELSKDNIEVVWITNLRLFTENKFVQEYKYVFIIEDWGKIQADNATNSRFLNDISNSENIALIIGDSDTAAKEYLDFLNEKNIHVLSPDDNEGTIKGILKINRNWQISAQEILSVREFYSSPIYVILYVINWASNNNNHSLPTGENYLAAYKSIIRNELSLIYNSYKGLGLALYYWSCFYREWPLPLLWEAFLKIADFYNGDTKITSRFAKLNKANPIAEILTHYVYLEKLINPDFDGKSRCHFHHDLILKEGLSQSIQPDWYFEGDIILELFEILLKNDEKIFAADIYEYMELRNFKVNGELIQQLERNDRGQLYTFTGSCQYNDYLKRANESLPAYKNEKEREFGFIQWVLVTEQFAKNFEVCIKIVIEKYIQHGPAVPFINKIYKNGVFSYNELKKQIIERVKAGKIL